MCDGMQDYSKCPGENYSSKGCLSCHICFILTWGPLLCVVILWTTLFTRLLHHVRRIGNFTKPNLLDIQPRKYLSLYLLMFRVSKFDSSSFNDLDAFGDLCVIAVIKKV